MRILKLHHPTGHPYWDAGEYRIEMPNGEFVKTKPYLERKGYGDYWGSYKITVSKAGVYIQAHNCSSGGGKVPVDEPKLIVSSKEYDTIEYVGKSLEMSQELKNDLAENELN